MTSFDTPNPLNMDSKIFEITDLAFSSVNINQLKTKLVKKGLRLFLFPLKTEENIGLI